MGLLLLFPTCVSGAVFGDRVSIGLDLFFSEKSTIPIGSIGVWDINHQRSQ
jgi:hypothetical protein